MSTSDLDNQLSRNNTLKSTFALNLTRLREQAMKARIQKSHFVNPNYYEGSFLNHHLIPVRQDLQRPFKLRKARKPYWRHQSPYGLIKPYNPVDLRQFGNTWVVNQCKSIIISETLSADWEIVPTNEQDFSNDTMQKKRIIETFFRAINRDGDTLKDVLKPFLNDVLDLGMGIMIKGFVKDAYFNIQRPNELPSESLIPRAFEWSYVPSKIKAGMLREVSAHDAGSFYNQPDEFGTTIGWWQWLNQSSPEFFSKREVVDFNYQPLSYNAYGISPVDVCKNLVNVLVTSVANMEQYMEDGAIPPAVGVLQKISDRDFDIFADRWEAAVSGDPSDIPLMSTGESGEFKFIPLVVDTKEIKQLETIELYQKIVMSVFHVTPAELGWTDAVNKASAEQQSAVQKRAAIFPLLDGLQNLINKYIIREFDPDRSLKFQWIKPKTPEEEQKDWDLVDSQLKSGFYTINMIKKKKGEPIVPWGNVPYSEALWTNLASEYDPSLFGFREQVEDANVAKITYAQTQISTLLEQMQYGLQNDKELTPIAVLVLNRLKLLNEAMQPRGTLSLPPSSVVETERMLDAMSRSRDFSTTSEVFNRYRRDELERFRETRESESEKMLLLPEATHKAVGVAARLPNLFKNKLAFYTVMSNVLDGLASKKYQKRIDGLHNPIEESLTSAILTTFRTWYTKIRKFFGFYTKEDMLQKFPSSFIGELEPVLNESMNKKEFNGILKNSFVDAFKIGFRTNNEGKVDKDTEKVSIKKYQPRAYDWLEANSLYFADKLIKEQQQQIKGIVLRGLGEAHDIPTITKSIQKILAPENEEDQKKVRKRARMIARTEIIRASVQGAMSQMKSLGASHWQHHTHFDERNVNESPMKDETGNFLKIKGKKQTCRSLHGRIFKLDKDKDLKFLPPIHPNCRCTILGVHKDKPKWRRRSKVTSKSAPEKEEARSGSKANQRKKIEKELEKLQKLIQDRKEEEDDTLADDANLIAAVATIKAELIIELFKLEGLWDESMESAMTMFDQKAISEADVQVFIPEIIDKRACFEKMRDKHPNWSMEQIKEKCVDKK